MKIRYEVMRKTHFKELFDPRPLCILECRVWLSSNGASYILKEKAALIVCEEEAQKREIGEILDAEITHWRKEFKNEDN